MNNLILDEQEQEKKAVSLISFILKNSPFLIILITVVYSIYKYLTIHGIDIERIIGLLSMIISSIFYFFINKRVGINFLIIVLFLGLFSVIKFLPAHSSLVIFGLNLPYFATFMFIFTSILYRQDLKKGFELVKQQKGIDAIFKWWNSLPD